MPRRQSAYRPLPLEQLPRGLAGLLAPLEESPTVSRRKQLASALYGQQLRENDPGIAQMPSPMVETAVGRAQAPEADPALEQLKKERMYSGLAALSGDSVLQRFGERMITSIAARERAALEAEQEAFERSRASEQTQYNRGRDVKSDAWRQSQAVSARTQELADEAREREQELADKEADRDFERSKPAQPTEGERKSATLATRLRSGLQQLDALEQIAPGSEKPGILERGLQSLGAEGAANVSRSSSRQQANAAQSDILDALLTASTGAAYTQQQFQDARTSYFPQPGDSAATVKAKKQRLLTTISAVENQAGRAAPAIDQALGSGAPAPAANSGWKVTRIK